MLLCYTATGYRATLVFFRLHDIQLWIISILGALSAPYFPLCLSLWVLFCLFFLGLTILCYYTKYTNHNILFLLKLRSIRVNFFIFSQHHYLLMYYLNSKQHHTQIHLFVWCLVLNWSIILAYGVKVLQYIKLILVLFSHKDEPIFCKVKSPFLHTLYFDPNVH